MSPKCVRIAVIVGVLLGAFAASAQAAPPETQNPAGKIRGVVPAHGQASRLAGSNSNLLYHNGPVMHTNTVYAIYWDPKGSINSGYESTINQYFGDVAAASGQMSNVYFSDTQYYDGGGNVVYSSTFAPPIVDSQAFPANGCRDRYTKICLTDAQIRTEIGRVVSASHLPTGLGTEYFLFTPKGVGSCYGSSCAFSYYCAYHSQIGTGSTATLYANMPYANTVPSACGTGQSPNGNNDADSTLSVTSHEHNETITDPLGTAWYDASGNENGDKCAWNFGTVSGPSGAEYNQTINLHHYFLQQEWSNYSSRCVLTGK